jgi:hypothetical protein
MTDPTELTERDKTQILLAEYNVQQTEIIQRTNNGFQLVTIGAVVFALLFQIHKDSGAFWTALSLAILAIAICAFVIFRDINKAAARVRELEVEINRRAGERLLIHQTYRGGAATGYWGMARPKPIEPVAASPDDQNVG